MCAWNIPVKRNRLEVTLHVRKAPLNVREIRFYAEKIRRMFKEKLPPLLSIAVIGDLKMRKLNSEFTGRDSTTDVLAFCYPPPEACAEIIVSAPASYRNARRYRNAPREEMLLYLIHGFLHVLGYNDNSEDERKKMLRCQRRIFKRIIT